MCTILPSRSHLAYLESIQTSIFLEGNINARIDSKVDEVKEEVVQVKSRLDKFSDNFENVHERISNIEDQMEDFTQLESDLTSFKDQWDTSLSEINLEACRVRKNNIIFQGIPGGNKDAKKSMNTFLKLCSDKLEMPKKWVEEVDVNECYCFPPKGGKGNWPMFLSLAKSRHREDLYKNAYKLKDSGIYMQNDLAPCLLRKRKDLQKEANNLQKDPHNFQTKMRDSPFDVWLIVKKPHEKNWERWKGLSQKK